MSEEEEEEEEMYYWFYFVIDWATQTNYFMTLSNVQVAVLWFYYKNNR